jgi:hypothetical protein
VCAGNLGKRIAVCAISLCIVLSLPLFAYANLISYGDFAGTGVQFLNVSEDTVIATHPVPLFGAPVAYNDSLVFSPKTFGAYSAGGTPDLTDSHLSLTIDAVGDKIISDVEFTEFGDYSLIGTGTSATKAVVSSPAWLTITKVNGSAIDPITIMGLEVILPGGGSFTMPGSSGTGIPWSGKTTFDVTGALRNAGNTGFATEVTLTLDDSLSAQSETSSIAFVMKKGAQITVDPAQVPEPTTLGLLGMGALAFLFGHGWRKRRHTIGRDLV